MNDLLAVEVIYTFADITKVLFNLEFSHFFLFNFIKKSSTFDVLKDNITDLFSEIDVDVDELNNFSM